MGADHAGPPGKPDIDGQIEERPGAGLGHDPFPDVAPRIDLSPRGSHPPVQLHRGHVLRKKRHRAVVVCLPVAVEDPALGIHLCVKGGIRKGGEDQRKGGLEAILNSKFGDPVKDRGCVFIKADDEGAHDADAALVETANGIGIFGCPVRELVHGIDRCLRERFEADVDADAARCGHEIEHGIIPGEVEAGMAVPPDIKVLENLQHGPGMAGIRDEIGVHHIEEAPLDKIGNVGVPVLCQPGLPSRLHGPRAEQGRQLLANRLRRPAARSLPEKLLHAAKRASDCAAARRLNDLPGVVEFFVKEVAPHDRQLGEVRLLALVFFLQASLGKIRERLLPYGLSLSEDHGIAVLQGLCRQGRRMESAQYHFRPFRAQAIGNTIHIGHVVGQSDDQGQITALPIRHRLMGLVYETDMKPIRGQRGDHGQADGGISEQGQADAECLVACLCILCRCYKKEVGMVSAALGQNA